MIFQSLVMIYPVFSTLKGHNKIPGQRLKNLRQKVCSKEHAEQAGKRRKLSEVGQLSWR